MVPSSLRALVSRSPAYTWMRSSATSVLLRDQRQGPGGPVCLRDVSPERAAGQGAEPAGVRFLLVPREAAADRRPVIVGGAEPRGGVERGALVEPLAGRVVEAVRRRAPLERFGAADPPPVREDERAARGVPLADLLLGQGEDDWVAAVPTAGTVGHTAGRSRRSHQRWPGIPYERHCRFEQSSQLQVGLWQCPPRLCSPQEGHSVSSAASGGCWSCCRRGSAMLLLLHILEPLDDRLALEAHLAGQERADGAAAQRMRRRLPARERVGQRDRAGGLVAGAELTHPLVLSGDHRFAGHLVGPVGL